MNIRTKNKIPISWDCRNGSHNYCSKRNLKKKCGCVCHDLL